MVSSPWRHFSHHLWAAHENDRTVAYPVPPRIDPLRSPRQLGRLAVAFAMYWPIGTPRIFATSSSRHPAIKLVESNDGLQSPAEHDQNPTSETGLHPRTAATTGEHDQDAQPPPTPVTPLTPAVQSVEHESDESKEDEDGYIGKSASLDVDKVPVQDPVLALRVSRTGHMFAVITKTSITIWQTKVCPPGIEAVCHS